MQVYRGLGGSGGLEVVEFSNLNSLMTSVNELFNVSPSEIDVVGERHGNLVFFRANLSDVTSIVAPEPDTKYRFVTFFNVNSGWGVDSNLGWACSVSLNQNGIPNNQMNNVKLVGSSVRIHGTSTANCMVSIEVEFPGATQLDLDLVLSGFFKVGGGPS